VEICLEPWSEGDLELLRQINTPEMKKHLGGPETEEQLLARNKRYAARDGFAAGGMFRIVVLPDDVAVGSIGYWEREWLGEKVFETGWSVLPGYQGLGIAAAAAAEVVELARSERRHRYLHAYPSVENPASNAICRKAGFVLLGENDFEYPPGHMMRCNDWRYDLYEAEK
jgi:RimJ/RimL family protein N-acetyltransferase